MNVIHAKLEPKFEAKLQAKPQPKSINRVIRQTPVSPRAPVWRPEPIGLSRAELRAIVAEMLG